MLKKIISSIFSILFCYTTFAQTSTDNNYAVGLRAYSFAQTTKLLNQFNSQEYRSQYVNGVFIKILDNQINYRFTGTYYSEPYQFKNQCTTCQEGKGDLVDYSFKIGFEKNISYTRIQPYFGVDVGYRASIFNGVISDISSNNTPLYSVESTKNGITFAPIFGIKLNLTSNLLLYTEGNLDFYYAYERRETVNQSAGSPTVLNKFTRMEYLLNPISAGIQFNFGSRN